MKDELPNIDTSGIDTLKEIKAEYDLVKKRLSKMDDLKDRVSEAVFEKVQAEYQEKQDALDEQAEPLKAKVREQYAVLRGLMDGLNNDLDALNLEKEELEFRNELGEFEKDDFGQATKDWEVRHVGKQAELDELEEMKQLFMSAFDSPEDLEKEQDLETVPVEIQKKKDSKKKQSKIVEVEAEFEEIEAEELPEADMDEEPVEEPMEEPEPTRKAGQNDYLAMEEQIEEDPDMDYFEPPAGQEEDQDVRLDDSQSGNIEEGSEEDVAPEVSAEDDFFGSSDAVDSHEDTEDLTDDLDQSAGDISAELDELEDELDESLLEEELDDEDLTGDVAMPPPVPDLDVHETQPGLSPDLLPPLAAGEPPPVPDDLDQDATLLMAQSELPGTGDVADPDGTMIISNPKIVSLNNATEGQVMVLGMGTTSMGRSPDNDIHITEDRISRKHAQVAFGPGGYAIYDLNSENGTYVNGNRIREHFLSDGDIIMIGTYKYLYRDR